MTIDHKGFIKNVKISFETHVRAITYALRFFLKRKKYFKIYIFKTYCQMIFRLFLSFIPFCKLLKLYIKVLTFTVQHHLVDDIIFKLLFKTWHIHTVNHFLHAIYSFCTNKRFANVYSKTKSFSPKQPWWLYIYSHDKCKI